MYTYFLSLIVKKNPDCTVKKYHSVSIMSCSRSRSIKKTQFESIRVTSTPFHLILFPSSSTNEVVRLSNLHLIRLFKYIRRYFSCLSLTFRCKFALRFKEKKSGIMDIDFIVALSKSSFDWAQISFAILLLTIWRYVGQHAGNREFF